jgi:hypothetical protein
MSPMTKVSYKGWPNCYNLTNGVVDLVLTTDIGPRIISFSFSGGENVFKNHEEMMGRTGDKEWLIYGGHRLWHGPEVSPRTYQADNSPVSLEDHRSFVRLVQPTEANTGIQKEIDVYLDAKAAHVRLVHRLRNMNLWAVELAPWAISVMAQGGKAIIPLPPRGSHAENLLPANVLTMWAYTDMTDPRWTWGNKYIMLRQDPRNDKPQKLGVMNRDGWAAYANKGQLFVKTFAYHPGATYPDWGCNAETFTWAAMLELETLGPLVRLEPMTAVEHTENWWLFGDVPMPNSDADIDAQVLPKIKSIL